MAGAKETFKQLPPLPHKVFFLFFFFSGGTRKENKGSRNFFFLSAASGIPTRVRTANSLLGLSQTKTAATQLNLAALRVLRCDKWLRSGKASSIIANAITLLPEP